MVCRQTMQLKRPKSILMRLRSVLAFLKSSCLYYLWLSRINFSLIPSFFSSFSLQGSSNGNHVSLLSSSFQQLMCKSHLNGLVYSNPMSCGLIFKVYQKFSSKKSTSHRTIGFIFIQHNLILLRPSRNLKENLYVCHIMIKDKNKHRRE